MKSEKEKHIGWDFNRSDEEDKTIVHSFEWKNCPKDPEEIKKAIDWLQNEIAKAFEIEINKLFGVSSEMIGEEKEILYGKENEKEPQGILHGISPIQQARESIQKNTLITSCICCHQWKIDKERTYLIGTCQRTCKDIGYDQICESWEKIS